YKKRQIVLQLQGGFSSCCERRFSRRRNEKRQSPQHLQAAFSVEKPLRSVKLYAAGVVFYRRLLTRGCGGTYLCLVFRFGRCRKSAHLSIQNDNCRARQPESLRRLFSDFSDVGRFP
ncbi:MAG: hypothetical protein K2G10_02820, partial [Alistipes sp.]|nr:hypothetical protein [Alistipes sp.]